MTLTLAAEAVLMLAPCACFGLAAFWRVRIGRVHLGWLGAFLLMLRLLV